MASCISASTDDCLAGTLKRKVLPGTGTPLSSKTVFFWASVPLRLVVVPLYLTEVKSDKSSVLDP